MISATNSEEDDPIDMLRMMGLSTTVKDIASSGHRAPVIMASEFGFVWIIGFDYEGEALRGIHVVGPAFTGKNSMLLIKKKLDGYNLSVKIRAQVFKTIQDVPIIPTNTLMHYAVMLHYAITGQQISTDDIHMHAREESDKDEIIKISEEHRGIWFNEQQLMTMFREGNPDYRKALEDSYKLSSGMRVEYGDNMRKHKSNTLVLLTLCSRACMEGGLSPSIAYSLNDYYAAAIEACKNISELSTMTSRMLEEFIQGVREAKNKQHISHQIQNVSEFIKRHLHEKITLKDIAHHIGYTEYYLSHKFKEEMGTTINRYIREAKVEEAKRLLSGTEMSIIDISDELGFSNRSFFYSSFRKETTMSPSEYRDYYSKV